MEEVERSGMACVDAARVHAASEEKKLPVIDLSCDEHTAAAVLRDACIKFGFFYIVNHGVAEEFFDEVFQQAKLFFGQATKDKEKCAADRRISFKGYHGFGNETVDPEKQTRGGTKEAYHVGVEVSAEDAVAAGRPYEPNLWPDAEKLTEFRDVMLRYYERTLEACYRVLRIVALALDLDVEFFRPLCTKHNSILRFLHYDQTISDPASGIFACGEHCDYGVITLLKTDEVPGLQIQWESGEWTDVDYVKGAYIVNIGDLLEHWTNDLFRSTKHRVLNMSGKERYSIPFFCEINSDAVVQCLPSCCSTDKPAKYDPVSAGDYLTMKLSKTYKPP
ncbi:uncharacterized protein LOC135805590 [Sycon ciliatum]|uniref:uncharacterized protein LOC135805590 n=1 Tax=Sycon ciliatum TaxID=27933 RepID=UPI0020A9EBC8|eukprot:scpid64340/ scgid4678/ Probable iron/ascorbate oxidoreductase DDB_G0283291